MKKERHVKMNLIEITHHYPEPVELVFNLFGLPDPNTFSDTFEKFDIFAPPPKYIVLKEGFFDIKNVIFNDPATIVFWGDGTKTVVKALDEPYDPEKGLSMAISKHFFGNKWDYYNQFLHWLKKYNKSEESFSIEDMIQNPPANPHKNVGKEMGESRKHIRYNSETSVSKCYMEEK